MLVLAIGWPIRRQVHGSACACMLAALTVASVGPYALKSCGRGQALANHACIDAWPTASPPIMICRSVAGQCGGLSLTTCCQKMVGKLATVMPWRSQSAWNWSVLASHDWVRNTSAAPDNTDVKISSTDMSKVSDANCNTRSLLPTP